MRDRLLAEGPVGEWVSMPSTATALMSDLIRFAADGTGQSYSSSLLGGEQVKRFTWKPAGSGMLERIERDTVAPGDAEVEMVGFRFAEQHSDIGSFWVMCDPGGDGFWDLVWPVVPQSRDGLGSVP
ncbi:hypothetical protein [Actinoplanes sp. NPDC026670]|uniref:hypothetical protein n=1 Tax=Actinoplanes sp. NPDC026670 TaxID=3154700 RepID=UPI0033D271E5